jgi:sterol desaturase/sphingolipid hydroxylase (fatty acid hydroxylase superfamily)
MEILIYSGIILGTIYISEIGAYFWHRSFSHNEMIPFVKKTHDIHHSDIKDEAHGDFFYVVILLLLLLGILYYLYYNKLIHLYLFLCIYIPVLIVFIWNWYVHSAYHIDNHWLNKYKWFQNDKRIHFKHHDDPSKNYGIATHFTDVILDTFDYGLIVNI